MKEIKGIRGFELYVPVQLDFEEIGNELGQDAALEFVKAIDRQQQNWEFTHELAKHFVKEMQKMATLEDFTDTDYCAWLKDVVVPKD